MAEKEKLLELKNVVYSFHTYGGEVKAVRDVSFEVRKGEILGIVGESGCGKSVTAQCIMRLNPEPPGFFEGGEILFNGKDVLKMDKKELRQLRGGDIGFVFQDPMTSLNPTMRVGAQIEEVFIGRAGVSKKEVKEKALEIMKLVGISDVEKRYRQYPHELSGGMKQRVMIAIALVSRPSLVICDEPTTSLDVTIEAQILDLLLELREKLGTSIIMITHDLGVIAEIADDVMVMYAGKIVERATCDQIFEKPMHPYTYGLMQCIPKLDDDDTERLSVIEGMVPSFDDMPKGCAFCPRCKEAREICKQKMPELTEVEGRMVRCFKYTQEWGEDAE